MKTLSSLERTALISTLVNETFDLLVIGGGVTGAGIALDAAARGLKVALVEKNDFASGTSSKSTKLVHGGLRYLKQFEIALVREVGRERAIVHKLAPHLVRGEKMLLPIIKDGTFGSIMTSLGLMVYDVLAGVQSADQRVMLNETETLDYEPLLDKSVVEGAGIYAEYRTDDARLTIEIIKTAVEHSAECANYICVRDFIYQDDKIIGSKCWDELSMVELEIRASYVVSAAGPWVDDLRDVDHSKKGKRLQLSKGVHIVVPHVRLPLKQSIYFDVSDGRMIFGIPRGKITYVGTTDTFYTGDKNRVLPNMEDIDYLLNAVNHTFPTVNLTLVDVESSWAGLRPLIYEEGKSASELSRKDEIFESDSGLMSIAGGKLTGYRKMAEKIVDLVEKKYERHTDIDLKKSSTDRIVLGGGTFKNAKAVDRYIIEVEDKLKAYGLEDYADYLVSNYGKQTDQIIKKFETIEGADAQTKLARSELWFAVNFEAAHTVLDFFTRRSGRMFFAIKSIAGVRDVILEDFKNYFDWSEEKLQEEGKALDNAVYEASHFS